MKKVFLVILLVLGMAVMLHAQESAEETSGGKPETGFDWDIRFGMSFPFIANFSEFTEGENIPFMSMLVSFALSSISLGGGVQYTIVPHLLTPGIYADIHFNVLLWSIVGLVTNWETNLMLIQPEIRFYNQFRLNRGLALEPFFGVNFVYITMNLDKDRLNGSIPLMNAGFILKLGDSFGFEYCYNFSNMAIGDGWAPKIHRIGFSWGLRDRD
jgi:hypothetical protein